MLFNTVKRREQTTTTATTNLVAVRVHSTAAPVLSAARQSFRVVAGGLSSRAFPFRLVFNVAFLLLLGRVLMRRTLLFSSDDSRVRSSFQSSVITPARIKRNSSSLGAVVFLAPPRRVTAYDWNSIKRMCLLMRAVRSVDSHLNQHYGPYPIFILVAKDFAKDPNNRDSAYTERDRALIRSWAPNSQVSFIEINMYSQDALEPGATVNQILKWRKGQDGGVKGRDLGYQSMCRLWSGRLQTMEFLQKFKYYLRMDDDSLLTSKLPYDPILRADERGLGYIYRRDSFEEWGLEKLREILPRHVNLTGDTPFVFDGFYTGEEPYNNFHISRVSFWSKPQWQAFWKDLNQEHAFFKYRLGDANVHAVAVMMQKDRVDVWREIPYVHNTNDMHEGWGQTSWKLECEAADHAFLIKAESATR
jgi:hypothetical protein